MATPPTAPDRLQEIVTSTGWRIIGSAINLVSETAIAGLHAPEQAKELVFGATFRMRPRLSANPATATMSVLGAALRRVWDDIQPLQRNQSVRLTAGRVHAMQWDGEGERDQWTGELIWRHPHPSIGGVVCTTHLIIAERPGVTTLGVRIGVPGGVAAARGPVGAAQARPDWLFEIARETVLSFEGHPATPTILTEDQIDSFVERELLSETRAYPVAVLAPLEDGGYLVPPAELAEELLGIAPLFVLDRHPTTFRLTDSLGDRRLSAYWGALRVYLPGFSCADWSDAHPLLRNDIIGDPVMRAEVAGRLAARNATRMPMPQGVEELRAAAAPRARPVTASAAPGNQAASTPVLAPSSDGAADSTSVADLSALEARLDDVTAAIARLAEVSGAILNELVRLRTTSAVRAAGTSSLERRMTRLDELLRRHFERADGAAGAQVDAIAAHEDADDSAGAPTLADIVRLAGVTYADTLLVLEQAERAAADSPYEDVDRAAAVLEAMAYVAQRRRDGTLGMSLREAFRELGIDYRRTVAESTSKRLRQQYSVIGPGGVRYECEEHLVLGSTYDPRHCLRIYFTSRAANEPRFVVGHVGRHFDVITTT